MKNLKFYKISNQMSKKLAFISLSMMLATTTLTGCSHELVPEEDYDIVQNSDEEGLGAGLTQKLEVPGESFTLVTEYSCDPTSEREWRVTSDKFLYLTVYTEGLPADTLVYIDNIHIDTSIKSTYAAFDGIIQDSMDDHVHSSQMIGFSIDDNTKYFGVDAIEGMNETFIQGTAYGYSGYYGGSVTEKRFTESNYVTYGVWANKFQIVYDLLVKGPNDYDFKNISVSTDFVVPITTNSIQYDDGTVKDIETQSTQKVLH